MHSWLYRHAFAALLLIFGCMPVPTYASLSTESEGECEDSDDIDLVQTQMLIKGRKTNASPSREKSFLGPMAINLDEPPKVRWQNFARKFKTTWIDTVHKVMSVVEARLEPSVLEEFWQNNNIQPEYLEELKGVVEVLDDPRITLKRLTLNHMLYELGNPTATFCSGIIAQQSDGSITHSRNLDYLLPNDSSKYITEITFYRDGKPLFVTIGMLSTGVHTAMRFGGWSFEQNTRLGKTDALQNLINAKNGALPFMFAVRKIMEEVPDYRTALPKLESLTMMASQYFILAGAKSGEGGVYTVDGGSTHPPPFTTTETLDPAVGRWYMIQTNDDMWGEPLDKRRDFAIATMNSLDKEKIDEATLEKVMLTPPLFRPVATIFTWIVNPAKGTHKLVIDSDVGALQAKLADAGLIPGR